MHIPEPANGYKGYREARLRFSGPQGKYVLTIQFLHSS